MDWFLQDIQDVWINRESWLIRGGMIAVGVTMFLVGLFKIILGNKIKNKLLRKTILSFLSLVLVAPVTVIYLLTNSVNGMDHFWVIYLSNCSLTIIVYWFYENTQLRELLCLTGKSVITKAISMLFNKFSAIKDDHKKECSDVTTENFFKSSYNEDDLTNL